MNSLTDTNRRPTDWQGVEMQKRIAGRYAAERRFKAMGIVAIALSAGFLAFLLVVMVGNGFRGFTQTELPLQIDFPAVTGGATASHPLGPWTKMPTNPLLSPGAEGEWDHGMVASATILKMGPSNWTMWYEATPGGFGPHMGRWSVGLAHATSPEGPWKKASAVNPIINESIVGFDGF